MHVAMEGRFLGGRKGGIGVYTRALVTALRALPDPPDVTLVASEPALPLDAAWARRIGAGWVSGGVGGRYAWEWFSLAPLLARSGADLYHGTANFDVPPRPPVPSVLTVHDLIPITHPELVRRRYSFLVRRLLPQAVRRSRRVIVPSQATRKEFEGLLPEAGERVRVIPEGGIDRPPSPAKGKGGKGSEGGDLLFVGSIERRKNLEVLLAAYRVLRRRMGEATPPLRWVGAPGLGGEDLLEAARKTPGVRTSPIVPHDELPALYRGARVYLIASLAEGFSLTPLEAMAWGVPVVASRIPVHEETLEGAARLVEPSSAEAWAGAIEEVLTDPRLRARLVKAGLVRARRFSWRETAKETLRAYAEALESRA